MQAHALTCIQPKCNNCTCDSIQGGLGYLSVCAATSQPSLPSHMDIYKGHPSLKLCCGHCTIILVQAYIFCETEAPLPLYSCYLS